MIDKKYPKVVIGALIYDDAGNILLGRAPKWKNKWVVFGGHVEWWETLEEAVRREVREETGLVVDDIDLVGIQESVLSPEFHEEKHMIFLNYCMHKKGGDVKLNDEMEEYVWIDPQKALTELELNKSSTVFIQNFINKRW